MPKTLWLVARVLATAFDVLDTVNAFPRWHI